MCLLSSNCIFIPAMTCVVINMVKIIYYLHNLEVQQKPAKLQLYTEI